VERGVAKSVLDVDDEFILFWDVFSVGVVDEDGRDLDADFRNLRSNEDWNKTLVFHSKVDGRVLLQKRDHHCFRSLAFILESQNLKRKGSHQQLANGRSEKLIVIDTFALTRNESDEILLVFTINRFQEVLRDFLLMLGHVPHLFHEPLDIHLLFLFFLFLDGDVRISHILADRASWKRTCKTRSQNRTSLQLGELVDVHDVEVHAVKDEILLGVFKRLDGVGADGAVVAFDVDVFFLLLLVVHSM
jgi:hypothetical protein